MSRATPEGKVKVKITSILDAVGAVYCMPIGSAYGKAGVSDYIILYYGEYLEVEAKATARSRRTALQVRREDDVLAAGGSYLTIHKDNIPQLQEWIVEHSRGEFRTVAEVAAAVALHEQEKAKKKRNRKIINYEGE